MHSIITSELGDLDNLTLEHDADPAPGPGEVRIATAYAGISFVDVLLVRGEYQVKPPVPFIPGNELSGEIDAVGADVSPGLLGQRVCAVVTGAFATKKVVAASDTHLVPDDMSLDVAAVFLANHVTAYYALVDRGNLSMGESVLVLGSGGGVGFAALQIAKALGAHVIASASTLAKRELALGGGADAVIDTQAEDWREQVKAANGGRPLDVVVDPVSGTATERAFRSLGWAGRHLMIGFASGSIAKLPVNLPLLKGAALVGVDVRQATERDPSLQRRVAAELFGLHEQGKLTPRIAQRFPCSDVVAAMKAVARGDLVGRAVLKMDA